MYSVTVLSDKEFEALPYPEMEQSLGVADPTTNSAYVRYTGLAEVDKYLVNHELEHLIEGAGGEHSDHYRNGLYYKGFMDVFKTVAPAAASFIPGIGPFLGPAMGVGFGLSDARQQQKRQAGQAQSQFQGQQMGQPMGGFNVSQGQGTPIAAQQGSQASPEQRPGFIERIRGFFSGRNPSQGF